MNGVRETDRVGWYGMGFARHFSNLLVLNGIYGWLAGSKKGVHLCGDSCILLA